MANPVLDALRSIVGVDHVLTDDDVRRPYETDWTGRYGGPALAVVRPGSAEEVAGVLRACVTLGVAVVTQAGNTGLVGGGVPRAEPAGLPHTIVVSMRRFDHVGPVDDSALQVTVGAGVTLASWQSHARRAGLDTPIDFAARDSATIGGAIATNAGGSRVLRFGTMRHQVVGIEAILADGTLVGSLAGLPKETVGLHWPSVLSGSEGTLAVITHARLRLVPWYRHTTTALLALESSDAAVRLLARLRRSVPSLDAVELIAPDAMRLVSAHLDGPPPVAAPDDGVYLVVDCADHHDPSDQLSGALADADGVLDTAVTIEPAGRERLLRFRDRLTEAIAVASAERATPVFKLDVAVPLRALDSLLRVAQDAAERDGARLIPFGHLAEGNVHLNYIGTSDPAQIAARVLPHVAECDGTISAEHGVGVAKTTWLHLVRTAGDLGAQAAIRSALDPHGILNPGVLAPASPADARSIGSGPPGAGPINSRTGIRGPAQ